MRFLMNMAVWGSVILSAATGRGAEPEGFSCQMLTLPVKDAALSFADLDGRGRCDLLALDPLADRLLIYRQRADGFTNTPDQSLALPPQTAWVAPYRTVANGVAELVVSTAAGLAVFQQSNGVFAAEPQPLVRTSQVFTNHDWASLISLDTNGAIPVISATQAWSYRQKEAAEWTSGPPVTLESGHSSWTGFATAWSMGLNSSYHLEARASFSATTNEAAEEKSDHDVLERYLAELGKTGQTPRITRLDLNRDGQTDLILWHLTGDLEDKTDIYVFLRGADGKLPPQPTQTLHCRGFPFPAGPALEPTPVADLKGDGTYELVLLEPRFATTSLSSLADMLVSRGVDLALTIRPFARGAFAGRAEASVPLTVMLSWFGTGQWPFFIRGDFNGDGRPDLLVQRSATTWVVFGSTNDGHWFDPRPAMKLELPTQGYVPRRVFQISDLNGDGRADVVMRDPDDPRVFIFLTQPSSRKGNP
jgi:hypothetical protein